MVEFESKLTKASESHKLHVPPALVVEKHIPVHAAISVQVREATPPYRIVVPTLQTKVKRFGKEHGLVVPQVFITTSILKRGVVYKVRVLAASV